MAQDRHIVVASATDLDYLPYTLPVAASLAAHAKPARPVQYHVLYDGPWHAGVELLQRFRRPNFSVTVHRLRNPFAHVGELSGFPPSTLMRAAIPDVLRGYDRAIYLDCDLVVVDELSALFDTDLGGAPLGATRDLLTIWAALSPTGKTFSDGTWIPTAAYFRDVIGLPDRQSHLGYLQSGVQLMDLRQLRQMSYAKSMEAIALRLGPRLAFADQCAMNLLLAGRMAILDPRWNVSPRALDPATESETVDELRDMVRRQRTAPGIIHFGGEKPWRNSELRGADLWRAAAAASHFQRWRHSEQKRLQRNAAFQSAQRNFPLPYSMARWLYRRLRRDPAQRDRS